MSSVAGWLKPTPISLVKGWADPAGSFFASGERRACARAGPWGRSGERRPGAGAGSRSYGVARRPRCLSGRGRRQAGRGWTLQQSRAGEVPGMLGQAPRGALIAEGCAKLSAAIRACGLGPAAPAGRTSQAGGAAPVTSCRLCLPQCCLPRVRRGRQQPRACDPLRARPRHATVPEGITSHAAVGLWGRGQQPQQALQLLRATRRLATVPEVVACRVANRMGTEGPAAAGLRSLRCDAA